MKEFLTNNPNLDTISIFLVYGIISVIYLLKYRIAYYRELKYSISNNKKVKFGTFVGYMEYKYDNSAFKIWIILTNYITIIFLFVISSYFIGIIGKHLLTALFK